MERSNRRRKCLVALDSLTKRWRNPSPELRRRVASWVRIVCFCYVLLVGCPLRYVPVENDVDGTWIFASNYAAARGMAFGRDVVWVSGPLGYLTFPEDIGANLIQGLLFQFAIWIVVALVLWELFRSGLPTRSLLMFAFFWGLASPLFWFNRVGIENLLFACALILLVLFHFRGGFVKFAASLALMGIIPLIKLTAGLSAAGALGGLLADSIFRLKWKAWPYVLASLTIPAAVMGIGCFLTLPSLDAFHQFIRASKEISGGYSVAMSYGGSGVDILAAAEALVLLIAAMGLMLPRTGGVTRFFAFLLVGPVFVSFKHGYVRQDVHIVNYFCFIALAIALISLINVNGYSYGRVVLFIGIPFFILWQDHSTNFRSALAEASGLRVISYLFRAPFGLSAIRSDLHRETEQQFPMSRRLDSRIRAAIADSPVAYLSMTYASALADNLNLQLYPVIQRYAAFTPFLDRLNADWVEQKGPKYLIFDGHAIDNRQPWAETPAMWAQVYRWYDTDILTTTDLLLVRRAVPRFRTLRRIHSETRALRDGLVFPSSSSPVWWTMECSLTNAGMVRKSLFRLPEVTMSIHQRDSDPPQRVILDVLTSPVLGSYLPRTLDQFAKVFAGAIPDYSIDRISFEGPGLSSYSPVCQVGLWQLGD